MNQPNLHRILLADNQPEYINSVIGFLALEGYEVRTAGSPEQAVERLRLEDFDLVLTDLRMRDDQNINDVSGLEIARFASECGIPCILVTAFPTVQLARLAMRSVAGEAYARDVITKSADPQVVIDTIALILQPETALNTTTNVVSPGIHLKGQLAWKDNVPLKLSKNQYKLLAALYEKRDDICTHAELIKAVYDEHVDERSATTDKRLRNQVERTKEKLSDHDPAHPYIEAVPGRGYKLNCRPGSLSPET